jgi:CRISPR Csm4 C-terminal domain
MRDRSGPFRVALRSHAAVDRLSGAAVEVHRAACIEFAAGAGLWGVASFADQDAYTRWAEPLQAAFRILADTGLGGERSLGWGCSQQPEFIAGVLPDLIVPEVLEAHVAAPAPPPEPLAAPAADPPAEGEPEAPEASADLDAQRSEQQPAEPVAEAEPAPAVEAAPAPESGPAPESVPAPVLPPAAAPPPAPKPRVETGYWLLSMFSPAEGDAVDWQRGSYTLAERGGRVESPARSGDAKKIVRMVDEGSVLIASSAPRGAAPDVAPDGFPHPVFRCGFALAVAIPVRGAQ